MGMVTKTNKKTAENNASQEAAFVMGVWISGYASFKSVGNATKEWEEDKERKTKCE